MKLISFIVSTTILIKCCDADDILHGLEEFKDHRKKNDRLVKKDEQFRTKGDDIMRLVDIQNHYRRLEGASNMNKLIWDDALGNLARKWAGKCTFKHGQPEGRLPYNDIGQNVYSTSSKKLNLTEAVLKWYTEKKFYKFDEGSCKGTCGHYTQLVWADSTLVGCAQHYCNGPIAGTDLKEGYMIVCNYVPPGNYAGEDPYVKDEVCSGCSGPCEDGLCISEY